MAKKSGGIFYRNAKTGRLVTACYAKQNPDITVAVRVGALVGGESHSAEGRRFVVGKYMRINPRRTVTKK